MLHLIKITRGPSYLLLELHSLPISLLKNDKTKASKDLNQVKWPMWTQTLHRGTVA